MPLDDTTIPKIAKAAVARDRCERAQFLLARIIEDWAGDGPEKCDNQERLRTVEQTLVEALLRVRQLQQPPEAPS